MVATLKSHGIHPEPNRLSSHTVLCDVTPTHDKSSLNNSGEEGKVQLGGSGTVTSSCEWDGPAPWNTPEWTNMKNLRPAGQRRWKTEQWTKKI